MADHSGRTTQAIHLHGQVVSGLADPFLRHSIGLRSGLGMRARLLILLRPASATLSSWRVSVLPRVLQLVGERTWCRLRRSALTRCP